MFSAPWPVRGLFWSLERVAPAVGARWAERIWFTLPRLRPGATTPSREAPIGKPFTIDVDGHDVRGETWGHGPAVYLMHGWAGRRRPIHSVRRTAGRAGLQGGRLRRPEPWRVGSRCVRAAIVLDSGVRRRAGGGSAAHGHAHAIVAHSMGAAAAAVALCDGLRAERVVMLAPMASPLSYARQFAKVLGFGDRTFRRLVTRIERRIGAPMRHFDVPELGRAVAMPPTLIIHDRRRRVHLGHRWRGDRGRLAIGPAARDLRTRAPPVAARSGRGGRGVDFVVS